jgi:hypothetical protein
MQHDRFHRLVPLTGIAAGLLLAVGIALTIGEPSGDHPSAQSVAGWYGDHQNVEVLASLVLAPLVSLLLLFYTAGLRAVLRSGEAGESTWSTVVGGATPLVAFSLLLMSATDLAISVAADHGETDVARTIYMVNQFSWLPWAAPTAAMLLATGIGGLRTAALGKPLAWISIVLGVVCVSPGGMFVFLALPLWLIATGTVLYRRAGAPAPLAVAVPALS